MQLFLNSNQSVGQFNVAPGTYYLVLLDILALYRRRESLAAIKQKVGGRCLHRGFWDLADLGIVKVVPVLAESVSAEGSIMATVQISKMVLQTIATHFTFTKKALHTSHS